MELSVRSMHQLIKDTSKVSEQASVELEEILERFPGDVAEEAIGTAR